MKFPTARDTSLFWTRVFRPICLVSMGAINWAINLYKYLYKIYTKIDYTIIKMYTKIYKLSKIISMGQLILTLNYFTDIFL